MRLKKAQKEILLEWIAEGLTSAEVNARAADFDDPFEVSRQQVDHYRRTREIDIQEIIKTDEFAALNEGLSKKSERVKLLKRVAQRLTEDLLERDLVWVDMVKGIGSKEDFQVIEYEEFNAGEVAQLRGVLDDIAKELGDRKNAVDLTSKGESINQPLKLDKATDEQLHGIEEILKQLSEPADGRTE